MIRRFASAAVLVALAAMPVRAQLPLINVPRGALRIDLAGGFYPNDHFWENGATRPLGSTLDGASLVTGLQSSLTQILGQPVSGLTLGTVTAIAAREHGVGNIGLAYGLTRRITIFGTVPLVFVRSRASVAIGAASARVGLNPGGDGAFFSQFDAALASLTAKVQRGDYAGDPATLALAQQTLASGSALRAGTFTLLADPIRASPVLPITTDPYGIQLLNQITSLQNTLSGRLGIPDFTNQPELPASALTSEQFATLVADPGGFGLTTPNKLPQLLPGDLEAGVALQLADRGSVGAATWSAAWLRFTGRFPTGAPPDPSMLLDQGTGDPHPAVQLDGIFELGRHRVGIRGEASYQRPLAANSLQRISPPDQVLVPPSLVAGVHSQPGDSFAVTARPFLQFAPHLSIAALAQYWWRGASHTTYANGQTPIAGVDPAQLDVGSAANAVVIGIGLSYVYSGPGRDGVTGLPVEAGWSIERTVSSGKGIFPDALTTRVSLRIYRPIVRH